MGCCLSREDDRFDGNEALLPKGRNGAAKHVETAFEKEAANGSYKSPSAVVAAADNQTKVAAKPQPQKKPVENVDLLGLNETAKPPTPLADPVIKAPSPVKPPPSPPKEPVPVVKSESPPKPVEKEPVPSPQPTAPVQVKGKK
ncbi:hypothetical protein BBO99_00005651 [Phytophthora kernoviae]|uniref:Uncharacterized protein n=2 Tax=Phytophthora kernoviae TaxID=325452 RepID=A0A3R7JFI1_9STRA|nr:hypothetical protein G195_005563 [Phytophthora kernoviae 00238/432]KAG2519595.1 hypothetical protein JM16_006017 [Phytophthora kernoviae]KAG2520821.1 hypothetical protein JM18_006930 [Phytophthora kernoviae]RLN44947.1 hypothetical protein BBI17_005709 [Phytophthora kernoviae]RLN78871.1 hypothetical protein BBO99_00005651 [Phytophthora kernoviae]